MPPIPTWYRGREAIAGFLTGWPLRLRWRRAPARANGQLAVGSYMWDGETGLHRAHVLDVLTLRGPRIEAVTGFLMPAERFPRYRLPESLA
jgi:RNA polymerase sigma-70 factor, ECF subfamily